MLITVGLLLIIGLTVATGYFVAQEFAFVAVDRGRLRALADGGDLAARRALRVTARLSFMLSGAQLGITVTGLLAGYVAEPYLGQGLAGVLGVAGVPKAASLSISVGVALLVATVVQMVLGELMPKNLAIARPEALARRLARSTLIYMAVAGPLIRVFDAASNRLLRRVGVEPVEELPQGATREDLDRIIAVSHEHGLLDADTSRLLDHGLDFRTRTAGEVMVPRVDVVTVAATDLAVRVVQLLGTGHTRFPVIGGAVDDVVGVVSVGEVADLDPQARAQVTAGSLAKPSVPVPHSLPLPQVLERMRAERRQLAIVIDEYGGFAGVISLEDIAEELVGPIRDEDDLPEPQAIQRADGSWLVPGRWRLDEVAEATGIALPEDDAYDTLSGLVMKQLGHMPAAGDETTVAISPLLGDDGTPIPQGQAQLRVERLHRHVPATVAITRLTEGEPS